MREGSFSYPLLVDVKKTTTKNHMNWLRLFMRLYVHNSLVIVGAAKQSPPMGCETTAFLFYWTWDVPVLLTASAGVMCGDWLPSTNVGR
jgi:hypothetical protein